MASIEKETTSQQESESHVMQIVEEALEGIDVDELTNMTPGLTIVARQDAINNLLALKKLKFERTPGGVIRLKVNTSQQIAGTEEKQVIISIIQLPPFCGFDKKDIDIINFIVQKLKNVQAPFIVSQLYEECSTMGISNKMFKNRVEKLCSNSHLLVYGNNDLKVKMAFALSVPVDQDFLNNMEEEADVELDEHNRIIKYKKKGGGLNLTGRHRKIQRRHYALERDQQMMKFLAEKCKMLDTPLKPVEFAKQFKASTVCNVGIKQLLDRYTTIKRNIYISSDFDKPTKVKMMFISSATIYEDIFKELQEDATVEIDAKLRITKYKEKYGSLDLKRNHSVSAKKSNKAGRIGPQQSSDTSENEDSVDDNSDDKENEEEVVTEEPDAEAISRPKLRKRKSEETSPTSESPPKIPRSELSNPQQNSGENIIDGPSSKNSQDLMNHPIYGIVKTSSFISSKEFLEVLRGLVRVLNSPMLAELREEIEESIEQLGEKDQKVPIDYILMSLDMHLYMMTKSATLTPSHENWIKLKDYLERLQMSHLFMYSPNFDKFKKDLHDTIKELGDQDKKVPIEKIRSELKHTLDIVIP